MNNAVRPAGFFTDQPARRPLAGTRCGGLTSFSCTARRAVPPQPFCTVKRTQDVCEPPPLETKGRMQASRLQYPLVGRRIGIKCMSQAQAICDTLRTAHIAPFAVARLQAGRDFRASLQANSQTPGSPSPLRRRRSDADAVTPTTWRDGGELPVAEAPVTLQPRSGRLLIHSQLLLEDSINFHSSFAH